MDILTIIGIVVGLAAIIGGNLLEGGHTDSLLQLTAFVIVLGGTIGAVMVQTPLKVFLHSINRAAWVFKPPAVDFADTITRLVEWSRVARKEGLLGLQGPSEDEDDLFVRKGLQLLVDGGEPEMIRKVLEVEVDSQEGLDISAAKVFEGLGGYSPTIGIIGAVMGLIHVMEKLSEPDALGPGIAVAFVATIYGVGLANLLFLPMANKIKAIVANQVLHRDMVIEGLVSIAEGENPRNIDSKLQGYIK